MLKSELSNKVLPILHQLRESGRPHVIVAECADGFMIKGNADPLDRVGLVVALMHAFDISDNDLATYRTMDMPGKIVPANED